MKQYLELLHDVLVNGVSKSDRTGTGTISVFGRQFRHSLGSGFPLLTTKKLHFKSIVNELIWFLHGGTNVGWLKDRGVSIWDEWATEAGDLGPIYGSQWINWPTKDGNINQIDIVIDQLRYNPNSRRILFHAWNPEYLPDEHLSPQDNVARGKMALAPCHVLYQFYVSHGVLSAMLFLRSSDSFIGLPYNIASLALLTHMLAQQCSLSLGDIVISIGDSHIYLNHLEQVRLQLLRAPLDLPHLEIKRLPPSIYDYQFADFALNGYAPQPHIPGQIAV